MVMTVNANEAPPIRIKCVLPFYLEGNKRVAPGEIVKVSAIAANDLIARGRAVSAE